MSRVLRCLALALLIGVVAVPAADAPPRFIPIPPEGEYLRRKDLMADLLMPNDKAAWSGFRESDARSTRTAIG